MKSITVTAMSDGGMMGLTLNHWLYTGKTIRGCGLTEEVDSASLWGHWEVIQSVRRYCEVKFHKVVVRSIWRAGPCASWWCGFTILLLFNIQIDHRLHKYVWQRSMRIQERWKAADYRLLSYPVLRPDRLTFIVTLQMLPKPNLAKTQQQRHITSSILSYIQMF